MIHFYVYDKNYNERLQYSHSIKTDNLEQELSVISKSKFVTKDIIKEKPPFDRGWVISTQLLNYADCDNVVTDKIEY